MGDPSGATERRDAALNESRQRFDAVAARVRQVHGLRLPRTLAVWDALWRSASELERRGFSAMGLGPGGLMAHFEDDGSSSELRLRSDPPELVTVVSGSGGRYGLWYDDPQELPTVIAKRDPAGTWIGEATALETLRAEVTLRLETPAPRCVHALAEALTWFARADGEAQDEDGPPRWYLVPRVPTLVDGNLGVVLPEDCGNPRATPQELQARRQGYRTEMGTSAWITRAATELAQGRPALALIVGGELRSLGAGQEGALALLTGAYEALGRDGLADIARRAEEEE